MLKQIQLINFLSFQDQTIDLNSGLTTLIGINGAGKSNLFRAIDMLKQGVSKRGLQNYIMHKMGGLDNIVFKGNKENSQITHTTLKFVLDAQVVSEKGFRYMEDIIYTITIIRSPSLINYYIDEKIKLAGGYTYLDFTFGSGKLHEKVSENKKGKLIQYKDFVDPHELALSQIFDSDRYYALSTIRSAINEIEVYPNFDVSQGSPIRRAIIATTESRLMQSGSNLAQILNTIKIDSKSNFKRIIESLKEVNPYFLELDFHVFGAGFIELLLGEKNLEGSIHVSLVSDGTLHYLCLLSIFLNKHRGKLVCIDEPESGMHPDMINGIARLIEEKSNETQFIISTHSENLLDQMKIDDILIFEKDEENSTHASRFSESDFEGWYKHFFPGRMWRAGDLGGNRW